MYSRSVSPQLLQLKIPGVQLYVTTLNISLKT